MQKIEPKKLRKEYLKNELTEAMADPNPAIQFAGWFKDAVEAGIEEPSAMFLATASKHGVPSGRVVLLKGFSPEGFVFFTNYKSAKGREIGENPHVALTFYWKELERQVRITGKAKKITGRESDEYFRSRPIESRIGAVASPQSEVIPSRDFLENAKERLVSELNGREPERPAHWGGFIVKPVRFEFWQGRASRLHDRILYKMKKNQWVIQRLAP